MEPSAPEPSTDALADEALIRTLCKAMLRAWNTSDAHGFAAHFTDDGVIVGFDGTVMVGSDAIGKYLTTLFARHETPVFVHLIRWVHFIEPDVAIAHGISSMPSMATGEINPTLNSVQMITFTRRADGWRVALFHSTPARFLGRPEEVERMTQELQRRLNEAAD